MKPGDLIITRDTTIYVFEKAGPKQIKARCIWVQFPGATSDEDVTAALDQERTREVAKFGSYGANNVAREEVRPFTIELWRELRRLQGNVNRTRDESLAAERAVAAPYNETLVSIRAEIERTFA